MYEFSLDAPFFSDVIHEYNQVQTETFNEELDEETALEFALAESMDGNMGCDDAGASGVSNSVAEARATLRGCVPCMPLSQAVGASMTACWLIWEWNHQAKSIDTFW